MPRRIRLVFPLAACVIALAGCGGGESGSAGDPASVVPRGAFLYAEAVVDPSGAQEQAARAIIAKFPGEGPPEQRLEKLISDGLRESDEGALDYAKDVKPWLGDKLAFFTGAPAPGGSSNEMPAAIVIATDDDDEARDAIEKSGGSDLSARSYKSVDYWRDPDEDGELNAGGVIDGFAVIGTEAAFKAAVDASRGDALSESGRYKAALEKVDDERLGLFYTDLQGIFTAIGRAEPQAALPLAAMAGPLRKLFGDKPIVATARAEDDGVVVDSSLPREGGILLTLFGRGSELLGELPADSWAALGQPDVGRYLSELVDLFAGIAGGREQIAAAVRRETGLDLDRDILGWIGDLAFFVRGSDEQSLGGGAVIESTDPAASQRALAALARQIENEGAAGVRQTSDGFAVEDEDTPAGVYFLRKGDRVVIAYGEDAARAALAGDAGLASNPDFTRARAKLGDGFETSIYVALERILEVARNLGADEAELAKAEPYLKVFDSIVGGTKTDGDELQSRVRINLR